MRRFWFNGKCSAAFGITANGTGTFDAPERDVESVSIAGVNGDLILDNGRFKNKTVPYPVFIHREFGKNAAAVRAWLMSAKGYCRLEDEYNPDTYRMAIFAGPIDFDMQFLNKIGETTLFFNAKPQRFLKSGDQVLSITAATTLRNPTAFPAKPMITVHGNTAGTLTVGERTVEIKSIPDGSLVLDCEIMDAYWEGNNRNSCIYAPEFPELVPGNNAISWTGGITAVEIIPRWWTL